MRPVRQTDQTCRAAFSAASGLAKPATLLAVVGCSVMFAACGSASRPGSANATAGAAPSAASTGPTSGAPGALAFANCMRSNGVPDFPDPKAGGGFAFDASAGMISSPTFKAAQAKCGKLIPGGGPPGPGSTTHPSEQTLAKLLKIAECMHTHGISQFPDPRTSVPSDPAAAGGGVITDFDGAILVFPSTMNLQAPAYRQALTARGAPPLGLPH